MSNLTRKKPVLRRVVDALSGLLIGTLAAGGVVLLAAGPIMNLPGKVDSNNALVVASVAPGTIGSQGRPIANLPGKVDANNALVVTLASGSEISGPFTITQSDIGTTSADGFRIKNPTAGAAGAQQYSPRSCWEGQGWKTDATAASQSVVFCMETQPVQGAVSPSGNFILKASINGGAFSTVGTFTSGGNFTAAGTATATAFNTTATTAVIGTVANPLTATFADWGTTLSAESVSVANTGTQSVGAVVGNIQVVVVEDTSTCTVMLRGGVTAPIEISDPSNICTVVKDSASSLNFYAEGGVVVMQNLRGATRSLRSILIGG